MKKMMLIILLFVGVMLISIPTLALEITDDEGNILINESSFPDSVFRSYIEEQFDKDSDGSLSAGEIAEATSINIYGQDIGSVEGISYLTQLTYLVCAETSITTLDVSSNEKLEYLYCFSTSISELNVTNNSKLKALWCDDTMIPELNLSNNVELISLWCGETEIEVLDVSQNILLEELLCNDMKLIELNLENNQNLTVLDCENNQLTELNVANNAKLTTLSCGNNNITVLDLSGNLDLTELFCSYLELDELDLSNLIELKSLSFNYGKASILEISGCVNLEVIYCKSSIIDSVYLPYIQENVSAEFSDFEGGFYCVEFNAIWSEVREEMASSEESEYENINWIYVEQDLGDVNGDGVIVSDDAMLILQASTGLIELTDAAKTAADVNGDGAIMSDDAMSILQIAVGLI